MSLVQIFQIEGFNREILGFKAEGFMDFLKLGGKMKEERTKKENELFCDILRVENMRKSKNFERVGGWKRQEIHEFRESLRVEGSRKLGVSIAKRGERRGL